MKRFLLLGAVLFLSVLWSGCGEVFRLIIFTNPPQFPNPAASHTVVTINDNGAVDNGSAMVIDVSGDTVVSVKNVGLRPVHAVLQTESQMLVVNQAVPPAAGLMPEDSVSRLDFAGTTIATTGTVTLPTSYDVSGNPTTSMPNFVATTEPTRAYVLMPDFQPNPAGGAIAPSVAAFSTQSDTTLQTVQVGSNPVAMAETPDGTKLYVANEGDPATPSTWTITAFNTAPSLNPRSICDPTGTQCPPTMGAGPIWLSARSDSERVYVLESDGTLAYLDTSTTAGPDTFAETTISVPTATYMWYDTILNRVYIAGEGTVNGSLQAALVIVDASQSAPDILATVPLPAFSVTGSTPVPASAVAVTSLPDGSKAYVGSVPSTPDMVLPTQAAISSVCGNCTPDVDVNFATYTYTLTSGYALTPGMTVTISGLFSGGSELTQFEGTFQVGNLLSGTADCPTTCFQVLNSNTLTATSVSGSATGSNIFPQVTVVNTTSNTIETTIPIPGFVPYDAFCNPADNAQAPRFRFTMAAGGDSSHAYLGSCDEGGVSIIATSTDTYSDGVTAPTSARPPIPPSTQNPPQNPAFMIAGP